MKKKFLIKKTIWILLLSINYSCRDNFENINTKLTASFRGNTAELFTYIHKEFADIHKNPFVLRELTYWVQYFSPRNNTQDFYLSNVNNSSKLTWRTLYHLAFHYKRIIELNEDEAQKDKCSLYGPNEGQIALCRIMLALIFQLATDIFGDVPYYSYNKSIVPGNEKFNVLGNPEAHPEFISQEAIYEDLLIELKEAATTLKEITENIFGANDLIYKGDPKKWIKFANSLRFRIANRINATSHITELKDLGSDKLILSNADNAKIIYGTIQADASRWYYNKGPMLGNEDIDGVSDTLINLLKGEKNSAKGIENPFADIVDPRLFYYAAPKELTKDKITSSTSAESIKLYDDPSKKDAELAKYEGLVYGIGNAANLQNNQYSRPGYEVIKMDSDQYLITAAEVNFILAERGNSDKYKEGIKASMEQWGVDPQKADQVSDLIYKKGVDTDKILAQKWIALYNQLHEAWSSIRNAIKNGKFPGFFLRKGQNVQSGTESVNFNPSINYPLRLVYPREELSSNKNAKINNLDNGDTYDSKFWWMQYK